MNNIVENIISGIIGGLILYFIQLLVEKRKDKKNKQKELNEAAEKKRIGKKGDKFLDQNLLDNYLPGLPLDKILQDFGQPDEKFEDIIDIEQGFTESNVMFIYQYKFSNGVIAFSVLPNKNSVESITLYPNTDDKYKIYCPYNFSDTKEIFGKARINREIISNKIKFETNSYINWRYSIIVSKYFYREIKHFTFSYIVFDCIDDFQDMENKKIDQLCISLNENILPVINFYAQE